MFSEKNLSEKFQGGRLRFPGREAEYLDDKRLISKK